VVTLYHIYRTGSVPRTVLFALLLLPFPLIWFIGRMGIGGIGATYAGAVSGLEEVGAQAVDLFTGSTILLDTLGSLLGGPMLWLAILGFVALAVPALRPPRMAEIVTLLVLVVLETLFLTKFAADLGSSFWPRYTAGVAVLLLPFAAFGLIAVIRPGPVAAIAALLAVVAMITAAFFRSVDLYIVREIPPSTREASSWVEHRPAEERLLLTRMGWQSSYIPLLARLDRDRYRIISHWLPDEELRWFACEQMPAYIITRDTDVNLLERMRRVAGVKARLDAPIARFGRMAALPLDDQDCARPG
jgi:hypothetical protein